MEKIISEFRVVETEDGFRIEIKGDKEKIRAFMPGFGRQWRRPGRHWHRAWGPFGFGFGPLNWMKGASCWGVWDSDVEEEDEPKKA